MTPSSFRRASGESDVRPYPDCVVRQLNTLTSEFYAHEADSFSATRQAPWHGWNRAWDIITAEEAGLFKQPFSLLDLGCGNLRFEAFLAEKASVPFVAHGIDNCAALLSESPAGVTVDFTELDIVESLLDGTFIQRLPRSECGLAVAFGLMHHLPTFALRVRTLQALVGALRPGGFALVSFWQFLHENRLAAKAEAVTKKGRARYELPAFAPGDYLLGWQDNSQVFRFCHHATDDEIDGLLAEAAKLEQPAATPAFFREVARFSADGKAGNLNRYVLLQRLGPTAHR